MRDAAAEKTLLRRCGPQAVALAPGFLLVPGYLDRDGQSALLASLRSILAAAPLFQPVMPKTGTAFSVRMSNAGSLGWVSDRDGYRYQTSHPVTGHAWPPLPPILRTAWDDLVNLHDQVDFQGAPEACLINYYDAKARMGLHQDRDEETLQAPVVSLSLGDTCVFRYGGLERRDATRSVRLASGDAVVFGGPARLAFHGVDRIIGGSSTLLAEGGRLNVTLRRVTPSA